ncbi:TPA: hypothetical protein DIV55_04260 [Patescibacteria group bacterium]|nr:hypothetical protein [Patescibacteria group bacterium]
MKTVLNGKVVKSNYWGIYAMWIRNGVSCAECARRAAQLFNEDISPDAFENYKKTFDSKSFTPSLLPFSDLDLVIDDERHLAQLILLKEKRLSQLLLKEDKQSSIQDRRIDHMITELADLLVRYGALRKKTFEIQAHFSELIKNIAKHQTYEPMSESEVIKGLEEMF